MAEYVLNSNAASVAASAGTYANTAGGTGTPGATDSVAVGPRGNSGTGITASSAASGATSVTLSGTSISLVAGCIIKIAGTVGVYEVRNARSGNGAVTVSPALRAAVTAGSAVTYYNGCDTFTLDNATSTWGDGTAGGGTNANGGGSVMFTCPSLTADRTKNVTLTANGSLYISPNCGVDFGTSASRWPAAYALTFNTSGASTSNLRYAQVGCSSFRYGSVAGKIFEAYGDNSRKRYCRIVSGISAGATSVLVADATGWQVGDVITLQDTDGLGAGTTNNTGVETKTITGITPGTGTQATISWTGGTAQAHSDQGYVANEWTNVNIVGTSSSVLTNWFFYSQAASSSSDLIVFSRVGFKYGGGTATIEQFANAGLTFTPSGTPTGTRKWLVSECVFTGYTGRACMQAGGQFDQNEVSVCVFRGTTNSNAGFYIYSGANSIVINDCLFMYGPFGQASNGFGDGGCFYNRCIFTGCESDQDAESSYTGSSSTFTDCYFGACRYYYLTVNPVKQTFVNCAFGVPHPVYGGGTGKALSGDFNIQNVNTLPSFTFIDCYFANPVLSINNRTNMNAVPSESFFRVLNREGDPTAQDNTTRYGQTFRDNSQVLRSRSSIRFEPLIADTPHGEIYSVAASSGVPVTFRFHLRYDTTYGTATPPSVTVSGLGITPQTFTAGGSADTDYEQTITVTPTANGNLSIAVSGQSTATTGKYWFSGMTVSPWIDWSFHYGYQYAPSSPTQTADPSIVADYATAIAYTGIARSGSNWTISSAHTQQEWYDYHAAHATTNRLDPALTGSPTTVMQVSGDLTISGGLSGAATLLCAGTLTISGQVACPISKSAGVVSADDLDRLTGQVALTGTARLDLAAPGTAPAGSAASGTTIRVTTATSGDVFDFRAFAFASGSTFENTSGQPITLRLLSTQTVPALLPTSGTITIDNLDRSGSLTGILSGSKVRIYNNTTATETYIGTPGTSYSVAYVDGSGYAPGDTLTVTVHKRGYLTTIASATVGASGWSASVSQAVDTAYTDIGVDGSTVTGFAADYVNNEVNVTVAADFNIGDMYAWWSYNLESDQGIRQFVGGITALDSANIRINSSTVSLYIDNTTATNLKQLDNRRIFRADGAYPVKSSGGGGIDVVWRNTILIADTGGIGVNVTKINGATVIGTGTTGDSWRGVGVSP